MNQLHNSYKTYVYKILTPPSEHMMLGVVMEGWGGKAQYLREFLEMLLELLFISFSL